MSRKPNVDTHNEVPKNKHKKTTIKRPPPKRLSYAWYLRKSNPYHNKPKSPTPSIIHSGYDVPFTLCPHPTPTQNDINKPPTQSHF